MNKPLAIVTCASLAAGILFYIQVNQNQQMVEQSLQQQNKPFNGPTKGVGDNKATLSETAHRSLTPQAVKPNTVTVAQMSQDTQAMQAKLEPQQAVMQEMIRNYDAIRSEPLQRAAHIEKMEAALAQYSVDVLPVALAAIKESETATQNNNAQ